MTFSEESCLSINEIIGEVQIAVDDENSKKLNIGTYQRFVKDSINELNYNAMFLQLTTEIDISHSLTIPVPKGAWNIIRIYAFNGECCEIDESQRVWHKTRFVKAKQGTGYTVDVKADVYDSVGVKGYRYDGAVMYYNIQNNLIMLSEACRAYDKIRIYHNGIPSDIYSAKMIPPFVKQAVIGYCIERACFYLKKRDTTYRTMWQEAEHDLYQKKTVLEYSKWDEAKN